MSDESARFREVLANRVAEIEHIIKAYLPEESGKDKVVKEAVNYSFMAGGKRLRPMIMQEIYYLCGGETFIAEPFMAAIEMIHTYSLIHDDLPAMDNDELRRGKPTTHVVYGEGMAVLAGDALLNLAFETAMKAYDMADESELSRVTRAFKLLADRAGVNGMIGGQTIDLDNEGKPMTEELLLEMYEKKTSALLEASFGIGAILAGVKEELLKDILDAARQIGLAFQIKDDILDVAGEKEKLGKPLHSDEKNDKTTYVTLHGLDEAQKKVAELSDDALRKIEAVAPGHTFLYALLSWLIDRDY